MSTTAKNAPDAALEARPDETGAAAHDAALRDADPREFERYALIAALTLLVLCLLWIDRRAEARGPDRRPIDDLLRVEIGGARPAGAGQLSLRAEVDAVGLRTTEALEHDVSADDTLRPENSKRLFPPPRPEPREYVVQDRDTLSTIAERELGTSRRASEIARLNGIDDPRKLRAGTTIKLPPE